MPFFYEITVMIHMRVFVF